jgi:hypothetical protein
LTAVGPRTTHRRGAGSLAWAVSRGSWWVRWCRCVRIRQGQRAGTITSAEAGHLIEAAHARRGASVAGPERDALEAVREALAIPHAATVGDDETRVKILLERVGHVVVMLGSILAEDATADVPWSVAYLRARLAEHPPAGYKTWDERMAELDAAKAEGR